MRGHAYTHAVVTAIRPAKVDRYRVIGVYWEAH